MSDDKDLDAIVAGIPGGLGANKGFWMRQLRDRLGQWAKMGRWMLMMARISHGLPALPFKGKYIGPSYRPGFARILVEGRKGFADGVYHVPAANMETIEGVIPEEVLERQGIQTGPRLDSNGNPVLPKEWKDSEILELDQLQVDPITDEDRRLAGATPTAEEQKIIDDEQAKSPLAQLPAGAESELSPEEIDDLFKDETPEAKPSESGAKEEPASDMGGTFDTAGMDPKAIGKLNAAIGKPIRIDGEVTTLRDFLENKSYGTRAYDLIKYDDNSNLIITGQRYGVYKDPEQSTYIDIPKMAFDAFKPNNGVIEDDRKSSKEALNAPTNGTEGASAKPEFFDPATNFMTVDQNNNAYWEWAKESLKNGTISSEDRSELIERLRSAVLASRTAAESKDSSGNDVRGNLLKSNVSNYLKENPNATLNEALSKSGAYDLGLDREFDAWRKLLGDDTFRTLKDDLENKLVDLSTQYYSEAKGSNVLPEGAEVERVNPLAPEEPSGIQFRDVLEKAIKDAMDGKLVSLDDVIDDAKSGGSRKGAPLDSEEDISWDDEEVTPAATPEEAPVPGEEFVEEDVTPIVPATEQDVALDLPENEKAGDPGSADRPSPEVPDEELTAEYLQEAFSTVGKMTDEELDSIAAGQDFTQDMNGFTPSVEQARALAAIAVANKDTVMEALAGAGKTSVLVGAAKAIGRLRPNDGVLILCFGNKNAADAKARVPRENSDAMTTHRLARRTALSKTQLSALKSRAAIISKDKDLAVHLGVDDTPGPDNKNIDAESGAMLVRKIITDYCNSDALAVDDSHVLTAFSKFFGMPAEDFGTDQGQYKIDPKWLKWAQAFWTDIQSDKKPGYYDKTKKKLVGEKRIKIDHDHYLKLWQLGNPDLSKLTVKGKPVKVILMDEAQDTNPTVAAVLKANKGRLQVSYVGDTNQNIFSFRGSKNSLKDAKVDADAVIPLTMTYRFGDEITGPANGFLNLLGHDRRMIGTSEKGNIVDEKDLPFGPSRAHLVRSNFGGMKDIMTFMAQGKKVGALSVFYNEVRSNYYYIKWLEKDFSDPERKKGPLFPDGSPIGECDFSRISNMGDWARVAKRDPKSVVGRWKKSYDMGDFDELGAVVESIIVDRSDVGDIDSVLDSSVGAMGRLWVSLDGKPVDYEVMDNGALVFSGDGTLSYVNGTKLGQSIKERGYSWNTEERGSSFTGWSKLFSSDDERQKELDEIAASIPNRLSANEEIPDVIVSTAHRAKGLEWDNVSIGYDWTDPENPGAGVDPKDAAKEAFNPETLRLAYVAVSRARKNISLGKLGWVRNYEGREGLAAANAEMKRPATYGVGAWDYREERKAEMEQKAAKPKKIGAALGSTDRKGRVKDEGPVTTLVQGVQPGDSGISADFMDGWVRTGAGDRKQFSKKIDGVRWELTQNTDGSVLLRNRSDSSAPSKKYDNMASLESNFKTVRNDGVKNNRENAKNVISSLEIDPTGKLAKMIDNGASGDDVFNEIMKTQEMLDAIESNDVSLSRLVAAIDKLNNGRSLSSNNSRKLKKPSNPKPRKARKLTVVPAGKSASLYDSNPDRQDDGVDIGRTSITPKMRDLYVRSGGTETVEQMQAALLALNPDAKVRPDGSIVWYRVSNFVEPETSKDFAGKETDFELRIVPSQSGTLRVVAAYRDSDMVEDDSTNLLYHYSPHKSLKSVLGIVDDPKSKTKSAGVERLLDLYFDRNFDVLPAPGNTEKKRAQYERYYGGIQGAIKKLRAGSLSSILSRKGSDDTKLALRTPEEDAAIALNGRDERLNLSTAGDAGRFMRVMRKEVPSFFTAIDNDNTQDAIQSLLGYVASIPDTNEAKDAARGVIKRSVSQKFPYLNKEQTDSLLSYIDDVINREILPDSGTAVVPHRYASGEVSNVGDVVRWGNNRTEYSYGRVVYKHKAERDDSGNYGYANYVDVEFPDLAKPLKLSTFGLQKAADDQELTSGRRTVRNAQLLVERSLDVGNTVNFDTGQILDRETGEPIPNVNFDSDFIDYNQIDYDKYADRIIGGPTAGKMKKASDLVPGDTLYDENTARLGTVKALRTGTTKSGNKVVSVEFTDGNKQIFSADDNVIASSVAGPKAVQPLTPLGETARDLGLGISASTGKASKVLPIHKTEDLGEENTSPVKDSKFRAVKPTDEARAAKNAVVEMGSDIRARVDNKLVGILKDRENLDVATTADVDTIFDEVIRVSKENDEKASAASLALSDFHAVETKKLSTAASRKAALAGMAADGYISSNGLVDRDKLATDLAENKLGSLANLVGRASDKNDSLFAHAYNALKDPATSSRVRTLQKAEEAAKRIAVDSAKKKDEMSRVVGKAARDAYKDVMAEEGIELDQVSMDEFDGHLYSLEKKLKIRSTDTFKSKQALQEFFDGLPSNVIRGLLANLKSENKKLYIMAGVKRAYMTDAPDGYKVHLSNRRNYDDVTSATDAAVHEVEHVMEHILPNINPLQHAYLYDRAVMFPGTENETLPNFAHLPGQGLGKNERALAVPGLSMGYMGKQYPEDNSHILNPNDGHFEVSTVLMQEVLSKFGIASFGRGLNVVTTDIEEDGSKKVISNVHFDPKTARYYTNDTMETPIDNVVMAFGRDQKSGADNDARDFAYGLLFSLSGREQTPTGSEGQGASSPTGGNVSVPKPSAAVESILKTESTKPDAGFLATILSKFGGGTDLTREEYSELLDYLSEEFGSGSGYAASQARAVKNYLAKIMGL